MRKRILLLGLLAALCVAGLSGCKKSSPASDVSEPSSSAPVITDISAGDAQTHVSVYPQSFAEGERVENLYYKRTADAAGVPCYEVRTSPDAEEYEMLPLSDTVVYTDPNRSECYYETVRLEYKKDGEPVTALQYQLYVSAYVAEGETVEPTVDDGAADGLVSTPDAGAGDVGVDVGSEVDSENP